jgi:hypothetical protein
MFKLYNYYSNADGNGSVGAIITIFIYAALIILHAFLFYNYLVFLHNEGRIIDIYMRVTGDSKLFFIPLDNEVSARYLRWLLAKVELQNRALNSDSYSRKHASVTHHTVQDKSTGYLKEITYIAIYRTRTLAVTIIL